MCNCHVSCVMCHMSCVMCHVSCIMCHVSCVMFSCVMCHVSCVMFHVSSVMCHVSCIMCHVSCVMCHVSCFMCHVSCVMCHVSCVMCHVSMRPLSCVNQVKQKRRSTYLQPNVLVFRKITKAKISCKWDSTVCITLSEHQYCTPFCSRAVMKSGHWTMDNQRCWCKKYCMYRDLCPKL